MTVTTGSRRFGWRRLVAALIVFGCLAPGLVAAHKVTVFAWAEGDRIYTQSKFSGGRMARNAPVEVYDAAGQKLLEGRTDAEGRFDFAVPGPGPLTIVLVAGQGHRNEWIVSREEIQEAAGLESDGTHRTDIQPETLDPVATTPDGAGGESDAIEERLAALMDKKLQPVMRQLRSLEAKNARPGFQDIIGGIGYIVGLVGVAAYVSARRQRGSGGR